MAVANRVKKQERGKLKERGIQKRKVCDLWNGVVACDEEGALEVALTVVALLAQRHLHHGGTPRISR